MQSCNNIFWPILLRTMTLDVQYIYFSKTCIPGWEQHQDSQDQKVSLVKL